MFNREMNFWYARAKNLRMLAHLKHKEAGLEQQALICQAVLGHPGTTTCFDQNTTRVHNALVYVGNMNTVALDKLADQCANLAHKHKKIYLVQEHDEFREWIVTSLKQGGKAVQWE